MDLINFTTIDFFIFFNILFALTIIFFEHNEPTVTWAWILVLFLLPYFGFFIYLIFGLDGRKSRPYLIKNKNDSILMEEIESLPYDGLKFIHAHEQKVLLKGYLEIDGALNFESLVNLNYTINKSVLCFNNRVDLFFDGEEKFNSLIKDIENATTYVHLQYYIIRDDDLSRRLIETLITCAKKGVEVKILSDKIGSFKFPKRTIKYLKQNGIEICFFPVPTTFSLNFRNHRKIAVIDGKISYVGGFNIGDEYLGKSKRFGKWLDCHTRINGDISKELEISFMKDWNFSNRNNKFILDEKYFPPVFVENVYVSKVQIVTSGPDTKFRNIELSLTKLINSAEKSIHIVTPYFVPDAGLLTAIINARLSGVKVTVLIPKNPDHPFVFGASLSYIRDLIDVGVDCFAYDDGFLHSKIVVVDGSVSSVGSANFDIRSFHLNFEVTSIIYSNYVAKTLIARIEEDLKKSTKLTEKWYYNRSRFERSKIAISRLLSPIL